MDTVPTAILKEVPSATAARSNSPDPVLSFPCALSPPLFPRRPTATPVHAPFHRSPDRLISNAGHSSCMLSSPLKTVKQEEHENSGIEMIRQVAPLVKVEDERMDIVQESMTILDVDGWSALIFLNTSTLDCRLMGA